MNQEELNTADSISPTKLAPSVVLMSIPSAAGVRATKLAGELLPDILTVPL